MTTTKTPAKAKEPFDWVSLLLKTDACSPARAWSFAHSSMSVEEAWASCPTPRWIIWIGAAHAINPMAFRNAMLALVRWCATQTQCSSKPVHIAIAFLEANLKGCVSDAWKAHYKKCPNTALGQAVQYLLEASVCGVTPEQQYNYLYEVHDCLGGVMRDRIAAQTTGLRKALLPLTAANYRVPAVASMEAEVLKDWDRLLCSIFTLNLPLAPVRRAVMRELLKRGKHARGNE